MKYKHATLAAALRRLLLPILLVSFVGGAAAEATLSPSVIDGGGGLSSASNISAVLTTGGVYGLASSENYRAVYGYVAQLTPISSAQLTLTCSPEAGGTTTPTPGTQTIYVGDPYSFTAHPNEGYSFTQWIGSELAAIASPTSISTTIAVKGDAFITAEFALVPTSYVAVGSAISVTAESVGLLQFTRNPKVYTSPDGTSQTPMSLAANVSAKTPVPSVLAVWKKSLLIYNKKDYTGKQIGKLLVATPMTNVRQGYLYASSSEIGKTPVRLNEIIYFAAPTLSAVSTPSPTNPKDVFTVEGTYFGKNAPKVLIEYQTANGLYKYASAKIDKTATYRYKDATGKPLKSCRKILETDTVDEKPVGYSQVTAAYPSLPKNAMPSSYVVLDNGCGMAAYLMPANPTASVPNGDSGK